MLDEYLAVALYPIPHTTVASLQHQNSHAHPLQLFADEGVLQTNSRWMCSKSNSEPGTKEGGVSVKS